MSTKKPHQVTLEDLRNVFLEATKRQGITLKKLHEHYLECGGLRFPTNSTNIEIAASDDFDSLLNHEDFEPTFTKDDFQAQKYITDCIETSEGFPLNNPLEPEDFSTYDSDLYELMIETDFDYAKATIVAKEADYEHWMRRALSDYEYLCDRFTNIAIFLTDEAPAELFDLDWHSRYTSFNPAVTLLQLEVEKKYPLYSELTRAIYSIGGDSYLSVWSEFFEKHTAWCYYFNNEILADTLGGTYIDVVEYEDWDYKNELNTVEKRDVCLDFIDGTITIEELAIPHCKELLKELADRDLVKRVSVNSLTELIKKSLEND